LGVSSCFLGWHSPLRLFTIERAIPIPGVVARAERFMAPAFACDEDLVRRLPLPLAQLYRRAHNAKTALERHLTAFYLWEAGLKLLASAAVVTYARTGPADPDVAARLENLARPALGHWWEFARRVAPLLAAGGAA